MKCFQNIDNFEGRSLDNGGPPVRIYAINIIIAVYVVLFLKKRITSKKFVTASRSYSTIIREPRLTGLNDQLVSNKILMTHVI